MTFAENPQYLTSLFLLTILVFFISPDVTTSSNIRHGGSNPTMACSNVPLDTGNEEKWSLEICAYLTHGSDTPSFIGHFTLTSLLGCDEDASRISFDNDTVNEVKKIIGPHEFYTLIEGLETSWLAQEYLGRCVYRFPFRLSLPAPRHRLYLVQMRKDYWGFNELDSSVFPQVDISVIANQVFFTLPWPILKIVDTFELPNCNRYPYAARFVATVEEFVDVFNNAPILLPQSDLPITNFYIDLRSSMSTRWDAYDCNLPQTTPQSFVKCMSGLKIDFIGDSHVRILYNHILRSFCGVPQAAQKGWGESQCIGFDEMPLCPRLSACLIYSPYLDFTGEEGHGFDRDFLILNFGNHPASAAHWTSKQFESRVNETFVKISFFKYKNIINRPRVLWLGQSPIPFRTDEHVRTYADARTVSRMTLFEQTAVRISKPFVENGNISYIDIFTLGMTAIQWSLDRSHLFGVDAALDGIVDILLIEMCDLNADYTTAR
jgi:hypothetical protein